MPEPPLPWGWCCPIRGVPAPTRTPACPHAPPFSCTQVLRFPAGLIIGCSLLALGSAGHTGCLFLALEELKGQMEPGFLLLNLPRRRAWRECISCCFPVPPRLEAWRGAYYLPMSSSLAAGMARDFAGCVAPQWSVPQWVWGQAGSLLHLSTQEIFPP